MPVRGVKAGIAGVIFAAVLFAAVGADARDPLWYELPWDTRTGPGWFEQRAARGDVEAMVRLGQIYEEGIGVQPDVTEAMRWYRMAAEAGVAYAQFRLAVHLRGQGDAAALAEAAGWFAAAAEAGIAEAAFNLAVMKENGQGVERDIAAAEQLYEQAFAGGIAQAALLRGLLALNADPPRSVEALAWFLRAEDAGQPEAAQLIAALWDSFQPADRQAAQEQAREPLEAD